MAAAQMFWRGTPHTHTHTQGYVPRVAHNIPGHREPLCSVEPWTTWISNKGQGCTTAEPKDKGRAPHLGVIMLTSLNSRPSLNKNHSDPGGVWCRHHEDMERLSAGVQNASSLFSLWQVAERKQQETTANKKTSSYSSDARSCVEPGLLANSKAEDNQVSTELLTLQGLRWATSSLTRTPKIFNLY